MGQKWGNIQDAADAYRCGIRELAKWAAAGLVSAYHFSTGWWFPLDVSPPVHVLRTKTVEVPEGLIDMRSRLFEAA